MSRPNQLAISRIGVIHLTWTRRLARQLLPFGLTLKQLHVLQELARRQELYPAQIAGRLFCDRPTATVILRNLEKQGWIEREPDLENRRRTRVAITPRGRAKVAEVAAAGFAGNRGLDLSGLFTAAEEAQLNVLLRRLQDHLAGTD